MLEIDEMMPFYICEKRKDGKCVLNECNDCCDECKHTTNLMYAKNPDAAATFGKFFDTFNVVIDDYGRLVCMEKENR